MKRDPRPKRNAQQRIQVVTSLMLGVMYVVAGFDHRWGWATRATSRVSVIADLLCVAAFALIHATFRANTHTAGTVRVVEGQAVVSSGPYGLIRHPMYAAASLLFLATPLALGSFAALIPAMGLCAGIVVRLLDEERFLIEHLAGYDEYRRRVRFRLIPRVW